LVAPLATSKNHVWHTSGYLTLDGSYARLVVVRVVVVPVAVKVVDVTDSVAC
jgi:hypothetical protein